MTRWTSLVGNLKTELYTVHNSGLLIIGTVWIQLRIFKTQSGSTSVYHCSLV